MNGFTGKEIKKLVNELVEAYIKEDSNYSIESVACGTRVYLDLHEIAIIKLTEVKDNE